jgi:NAD(P)-dependent dehydrogenase (short-subunit alcohol dehydrogenase family)
MAAVTPLSSDPARAGHIEVLEVMSRLLSGVRRVQDVNVMGVFLGMRTVAPAMTERRAGSMLNVSSVGLTGPPYPTAYAASKWAARGMGKVTAQRQRRLERRE